MLYSTHNASHRNRSEERNIISRKDELGKSPIEGRRFKGVGRTIYSAGPDIQYVQSSAQFAHAQAGYRSLGYATFTFEPN